MGNQSEARKSFLFGEPDGFFDTFNHIEALESPLRPPLLAFKANLSSALRVGNVPFQLIQAAVLDERFNQLMIAEKIRCLNKVDAGEIAETDTEKVAAQAAGTRMKDELKNADIVHRHADRTLSILDGHLRTGEFRSSAQELLRQVLVICWGAFEILVNDSLRVLLNERPTIIRTFADAKPYRDLLSGRILLEALEANSFNLSSAMGNIFCDVVKLDSLEKIRDAIRLSLAQPSIDVLLRDERLWLISQQRHLIVHRRGLVDARYIERTSDRMMIGEHIKFDANYIEASLEVVRDIGCALFSAAQKRLADR